MFIGYQNNIATFMAETKEELESLPCVVLDKIEETPFAEMFNGVIYISEEELTQAKADEVRAVRNSYLEKYVDPVVCNPLRWAELTPEEQQQYADYRRYLLDITEDESFPNIVVLTFDEWVESEKMKALEEENTTVAKNASVEETEPEVEETEPVE